MTTVGALRTGPLAIDDGRRHVVAELSSARDRERPMRAQ